MKEWGPLRLGKKGSFPGKLIVVACADVDFTVRERVGSGPPGHSLNQVTSR